MRVKLFNALSRLSQAVMLPSSNSSSLDTKKQRELPAAVSSLPLSQVLRLTALPLGSGGPPTFLVPQLASELMVSGLQCSAPTQQREAERKSGSPLTLEERWAALSALYGAVGEDLRWLPGGVAAALYLRGGIGHGGSTALVGAVTAVSFPLSMQAKLSSQLGVVDAIVSSTHALWRDTTSPSGREEQWKKLMEAQATSSSLSCLLMSVLLQLQACCCGSASSSGLPLAHLLPLILQQTFVFAPAEASKWKRIQGVLNLLRYTLHALGDVSATGVSPSPSTSSSGVIRSWLDKDREVRDVLDNALSVVHCLLSLMPLLMTIHIAPQSSSLVRKGARGGKQQQQLVAAVVIMDGLTAMWMGSRTSMESLGVDSPITTWWLQVVPALLQCLTVQVGQVAAAAPTTAKASPAEGTAPAEVTADDVIHTVGSLLSTMIAYHRRLFEKQLRHLQQQQQQQQPVSAAKEAAEEEELEVSDGLPPAELRSSLGKRSLFYSKPEAEAGVLLNSSSTDGTSAPEPPSSSAARFQRRRGGDPYVTDGATESSSVSGAGASLVGACSSLLFRLFGEPSEAAFASLASQFRVEKRHRRAALEDAWLGLSHAVQQLAICLRPPAAAPPVRSAVNGREDKGDGAIPQQQQSLEARGRAAAMVFAVLPPSFFEAAQRICDSLASVLLRIEGQARLVARERVTARGGERYLIHQHQRSLLRCLEVGHQIQLYHHQHSSSCHPFPVVDVVQLWELVRGRGIAKQGKAGTSAVYTAHSPVVEQLSCTIIHLAASDLAQILSRRGAVAAAAAVAAASSSPTATTSVTREGELGDAMMRAVEGALQVLAAMVLPPTSSDRRDLTTVSPFAKLAVAQSALAQLQQLSKELVRHSNAGVVVMQEAVKLFQAYLRLLSKDIDLLLLCGSSSVFLDALCEAFIRLRVPREEQRAFGDVVMPVVLPLIQQALVASAAAAADRESSSSSGGGDNLSSSSISATLATASHAEDCEAYLSLLSEISRFTVVPGDLNNSQHFASKQDDGTAVAEKKGSAADGSQGRAMGRREWSEGLMRLITYCLHHSHRGGMKRSRLVGSVVVPLPSWREGSECGAVVFSPPVITRVKELLDSSTGSLGDAARQLLHVSAMSQLTLAPSHFTGRVESWEASLVSRIRSYLSVMRQVSFRRVDAVLQQLQQSSAALSSTPMAAAMEQWWETTAAARQASLHLRPFFAAGGRQVSIIGYGIRFMELYLRDAERQRLSSLRDANGSEGASSAPVTATTTAASPSSLCCDASVTLLDFIRYLTAGGGSWALVYWTLNAAEITLRTSSSHHQRGPQIRAIALSSILAQMFAIPSPSSSRHQLAAGFFVLPANCSKCLCGLGDVLSSEPTTLLQLQRRSPLTGLLLSPTAEESQVVVFSIKQAALYLRGSLKSFTVEEDTAEEVVDDDATAVGAAVLKPIRYFSAKALAQHCAEESSSSSSGDGTSAKTKQLLFRQRHSGAAPQQREFTQYVVALVCGVDVALQWVCQYDRIQSVVSDDLRTVVLRSLEIMLEECLSGVLRGGLTSWEAARAQGLQEKAAAERLDTDASLLMWTYFCIMASMGRVLSSAAMAAATTKDPLIHGCQQLFQRVVASLQDCRHLILREGLRSGIGCSGLGLLRRGLQILVEDQEVSRRILLRMALDVFHDTQSSTAPDLRIKPVDDLMVMTAFHRVSMVAAVHPVTAGLFQQFWSALQTHALAPSPAAAADIIVSDLSAFKVVLQRLAALQYLADGQAEVGDNSTTSSSSGAAVAVQWDCDTAAWLQRAKIGEVELTERCAQRRPSEDGGETEGLLPLLDGNSSGSGGPPSSEALLTYEVGGEEASGVSLAHVEMIEEQGKALRQRVQQWKEDQQVASNSRMASSSDGGSSLIASQQSLILTFLSNVSALLRHLPLLSVLVRTATQPSSLSSSGQEGRAAGRVDKNGLLVTLVMIHNLLVSEIKTGSAAAVDGSDGTVDGSSSSTAGAVVLVEAAMEDVWELTERLWRQAFIDPTDQSFCEAQERLQQQVKAVRLSASVTGAGQGRDGCSGQRRRRDLFDLEAKDCTTPPPASRISLLTRQLVNGLIASEDPLLPRHDDLRSLPVAAAAAATATTKSAAAAAAIAACFKPPLCDDEGEKKGAAGQQQRMAIVSILVTLTILLRVRRMELSPRLTRLMATITTAAARRFVLLRPRLDGNSVNVSWMLWSHPHEAQMSVKAQREAAYAHCQLPSLTVAPFGTLLPPRLVHVLTALQHLMEQQGEGDGVNDKSGIEEWVADYLRDCVVYLRLLSTLAAILQPLSNATTTTLEEGRTEASELLEHILLHWLNLSANTIHHVDCLCHMLMDMSSGGNETSADPARQQQQREDLIKAFRFVEDLRGIVVTSMREAILALLSGTSAATTVLQSVLFGNLFTGISTQAMLPELPAALACLSEDVWLGNPLHYCSASPTAMGVFASPAFVSQLCGALRVVSTQSVANAIGTALTAHVHEPHVELSPVLSCIARLITASSYPSWASRFANIRLLCESTCQQLLQREDFRRALQPHTLSTVDQGAAGSVTNEVLLAFLAVVARADVQLAPSTLAPLLHYCMGLRPDVFGQPPIPSRLGKLTLARGSGAAAGSRGGGWAAAGDGEVEEDEDALLLAFSPHRVANSHAQTLARLHLSLPTTLELVSHLLIMRRLSHEEHRIALGAIKAADDARRDRVRVIVSRGEAEGKPVAPSLIIAAARLDVKSHLAKQDIGGDVGVALLHLRFALRKAIHWSLLHACPRLPPALLGDVVELVGYLEGLSEPPMPVTKSQAEEGHGGHRRVCSGHESSTRRAWWLSSSTMDGMTSRTVRLLVSRAMDLDLRIASDAMGGVLPTRGWQRVKNVLRSTRKQQLSVQQHTIGLRRSRER